VYDVWPGYQLVAYGIPDAVTLRQAGARAGFFVYAFLSGSRVGYWNWTYDPADLERAMLGLQRSLDPAAPREAIQAPGGEAPTIRPLYNRAVEYTTRNQPMPQSTYLDLSDSLEGAPEPEPSGVIPIRWQPTGRMR
jgi:hypothetical protein